MCNLNPQNGSEFINCVFLNNSGNDAGAAFANNNGAVEPSSLHVNLLLTLLPTLEAESAWWRPDCSGLRVPSNAANSGGGIYVNGNPFFGFDTATVVATFCDNDPDAYAGLVSSTIKVGTSSLVMNPPVQKTLTDL